MHGSVYFILRIYVNILCMGVYVYTYIYICVCICICMYACIHMQVFNGFPYAKVFCFSKHSPILHKDMSNMTYF